MLLALAIPRTVAAWQSRSAAPVISSLSAGIPVTDEALMAAAEKLTEAIAWVESDRRLSNLAQLLINQGIRLPNDDPRRKSLFDSAAGHLRRALSVNPANAVTWFRLSYALEQTGAPRREVATCLIKMLDTAPYDRGLWLTRSIQLVNYWHELLPDERRAFESNVRTMWSADLDQVRQFLLLAAALGGLDTIGSALSGDPQARALIEELRSTWQTPRQ